MSRHRARRRLTLAYDKRVVAEGLDVEIPDRGFTAIVGPNACGKSTLLRALARMLKPRRAPCCSTARRSPSCRARRSRAGSACSPQTATARTGSRVVDLVARGRHPHQSLLRQWSRDDERAVQAAMAATRVDDLAERPGRRALRRSAPARLAGDGARAGDAAAAARRADDVPRHPAPDRGARPVRRAARAGPHARRRAARPQPGVPLRRPPDRDARRARRRARRAGARSSTPSSSSTSSASAAASSPIPETGTPMIVPAARKAIAARV